MSQNASQWLQIQGFSETDSIVNKGFAVLDDLFTQKLGF